MTDAYLPFPRPQRRPRRSTEPLRIERGARSCWGYGPGLAALLDELGVVRMWDPIRSQGRTKVVTFPADRADDLISLIEHRDGRPAELTEVDR